MDVIPEIAADADSLTVIRRDLHAHPETAFEEIRTAEIVARELEALGLEVTRGIAKTGVVGTLRAGGSNRAIGLRADMDALEMVELNEFGHKSTHPTKMHACGHDGHTTMLLGAARYLARHRDFQGTVHFIFQPAEEGAGGGRVMVEEGLFDRFPCDAVYGMHNMPGIPLGSFAATPGPILAASDQFRITFTGRGGHGAFPHQAADPVPAAAALIQAVQTVVARRVDPLDSAVVSVTQMHAGHANNVIPESATVSGTARSYRPETRDLIEESLNRLADGIAAGHGLSAEVEYSRRYPATINDADATERTARVVTGMVGEDRVLRDYPPSMGGEDFAFMLNERPGSMIFIGNGEDCPWVHSPRYDFDDRILPLGASYWVRLVQQELGQREADVA